MSKEGQNGQSEEELYNRVAKALREGDDAEVNKLMAEPDDNAPEEDKNSEPAQPVNDEPEAPESASQPPEAPEPDEPTPEDPLEGLDEKAREYVRSLKEERDQLDRKVKSELGRVPNLQRENAQIKREIAELKRNLRESPPTSHKEKVPTPKQGKIAEKLAQLREVDPALADIFEAMQEEVINPLREDLGNEIKDVRGIFASKEEEQLWTTEKSKLLERYPQADEIFKLPLYRDWKETLTPAQKAMASSIYADDVTVALEQFARYAAVVQPELVRPVETPAPAPATSTTPGNPAAKVVEERNKRLAAKPPTGGTPTPKFGDGLPDTEEGLYEYYRKKIRAGEM